ncbi:probable F-box protein At2g36090 [Mercurialis annua]|uniref:probable F-box protein At2g36090 n=1 Tax=Mercurialis annua TaxID=3986 RepID=UPI00215EEC0D|nr:probable F-box protein At2g36090 [Mercurialis annua]
MASSPSPSSTTVERGCSANISAIHEDILQTHILTRLDGPSLASTSCTSPHLNFLSSQRDLWFNICSSTWPSTRNPRVLHVISSFLPDGPRSFFSASFPPVMSNSHSSANTTPFPPELISAVDIYYKNELIFSRVTETEAESSWFNCSPFRIDMLDPKDTCQTMIRPPENEEDLFTLSEELELSWILIDPAGKRAMNVSSNKPVSVQRHWLSGEVHARFGLVLSGEPKGRASEFVQCGILVTCGGGTQGGGGGMHVREVSLQMEDMDGKFLKGKGSLGIIQRAFEGKKGIKGRMGEEGKRRDERFLKMKRERKEKKLRNEGTLDVLCVAFGILVFASLGLILLLK